MTEKDNFETLGDAYDKYPQSTLVMRKQYVDELNASIAQLEDDNALLKRNNENLRIEKFAVIAVLKQYILKEQSLLHCFVQSAMKKSNL